MVNFTTALCLTTVAGVSALGPIERPSKEDSLAAFNTIDENDDGFLTLEELEDAEVKSSIGNFERTWRWSLKKMFRRADKNDDAQLEFNEVWPEKEKKFPPRDTRYDLICNFIEGCIDESDYDEDDVYDYDEGDDDDTYDDTNLRDLYEAY